MLKSINQKAVVNWPFLHCTYAELVNSLLQLKLIQVFMIAGWGVTVDSNSQCKIVWGETRAHGVPFHDKNKLKNNKNLPNYSHPLSI